MKRRTPIPAIRARCKGCAESLKEIRECQCDDCQLYEYRLGHRPKGKALRTPRKAIKAYCLWCMGFRGSEYRVCYKRAKECDLEDCPLWHLRPGQKQARKPEKGQLQAANGMEGCSAGVRCPEDSQGKQAALFDAVS